MKYHVEFDVEAPEKATASQAREWIRFMCGYSGSISPENPLKKTSFDPAYGSLKIQCCETRRVRQAVMLAAWQYRKGEGLSMSEALKRAWADCKAVMAMAAKPKVLYFAGYALSEGVQYGKAENF